MGLFAKLTGAALTGAVLFAGVAEAKELRLGTITPDNTIWAKQMQGYVAKVAELSGGDLTIEYFGNAQLGTMGDTMKMTLTGRLDMWVGATPALAAVTPELALWSLPYIFETPEEAACVVPKLIDITREKIGGKYFFVGATAVGTQSLGLDRPANRPEDVANLKLRTAPLKTTMAFFSSIGANPVPLAAAETSAALGTGLVDGVDFAPTFYVATGANKAATVFTPTEHTYNVGGVIVSAKTWAGLSDGEKQVLQDAMVALDFAASAQQIKGFEAKMIGAHKKSGGTVTELSDEDRAAWKAAGIASWDVILPKLRGDVDGYMAAITAAKADCAH